MWKVGILCLLYLVGVVYGDSAYFNLMRRLLHQKGYNPTIRPVKDHGTTLVVDLGLHVSQILHLDEKNQVLQGKYWLYMRWIDEYMTWNASEFNNIDMVQTTASEVWVPDIVLFNSIQSDMFSCDIQHNLVRLFSDGTVVWVPSCVLETFCQVNVVSYPFDEQACQLQMGPWSYGAHLVDVGSTSFEVPEQYFNPSGEWKVKDITFKRRIDSFVNDTSFALAVFSLNLQRKPLFYVVNLMVPCLILAAVGSLTFVTPPQSGDKLMLSLMTLVSITVYQMVVADRLPATSDQVSVLSVFIVVCVLLLSAAIVVSVVSSKFCTPNPLQNDKPPPRWVSKVFIMQIGKIIMCGWKDIKIDKQGNAFLSHKEESKATKNNAEEMVPINSEGSKDAASSAHGDVMTSWVLLTAVLNRISFIIYWIILLVTFICICLS